MARTAPLFYSLPCLLRVTAVSILHAVPAVNCNGMAKMNRTWGWAQIAIGYGLLEVALWTEGHTQQIASLAATGFIILATLINRRSLRQLGLTRSGFTSSLLSIAVAALVATLLIFTAWIAGTLHPLYGTRPPLSRSFGYAIWALVQQFILNSFFYLTLEQLLEDSNKAMIAAAALFCLAHLPSIVLMIATLAAAFFFILIFQRSRNIYPLGVAHAMLGLALAASLPDPILRHMRVGIAYLHFVAR